MTKNDAFPYGKVRISNDIIATIAIKATTEVEGVCDVAGSHLVEHTLEPSPKKVKGKLTLTIKENYIYVDIPVILYYDVKVQEVCEEIQKRIKKYIEMMTGLTVMEVNVTVEDLVIEIE